MTILLIVLAIAALTVGLALFLRRKPKVPNRVDQIEWFAAQRHERS